MNDQKTHIPHYIIPVIILFFNGIMIIFPKEIFTGAKKGLDIWLQTVVPSLLPFMITTNCLMLLDFPRLLGRLLQPVTLRIFNLTGIQAFPLAVGLTAGYPMGLKTIADLYKNGDISKAAAHRLMLYSNNAGALFILGTVGTGFLGNIRAGYFILLCSFLSVLTLAIISGMTVPRQYAVNMPTALDRFDRRLLSHAIENAVKSILTVGGYIILFSVLAEIFDILHIFDGLSALFAPLGLTEKICRALAIGIFEVTNGCREAAGTDKTAVLTTAALCGWGGLSVHAQSMEFINDTDLSCVPYLLGKLLTSALCLGYGIVLWGRF